MNRVHKVLLFAHQWNAIQDYNRLFRSLYFFILGINSQATSSQSITWHHCVAPVIYKTFNYIEICCNNAHCTFKSTTRRYDQNSTRRHLLTVTVRYKNERRSKKASSTTKFNLTLSLSVCSMAVTFAFFYSVTLNGKYKLAEHLATLFMGTR